jgi:SAM-dependent methyltransferase
LTKPYSEACDRNRQPILTVIEPLLSRSRRVLEIGSGSGQHAVYFAEKMPHLIWQSSDRAENLTGIKIWLDEASLPNTPPPLPLDVSQNSWPDLDIDAVFSANTVHIMSWEAVSNFFCGVGKLLAKGGIFILYGPFNYNNQFSSDSNRQFNAWLLDRDPRSGIRNYEDLNDLALNANLRLTGDFIMPANNRILCWQKQPE